MFSKRHFIFEAVLMSISLIMLIIFILTKAAMYFLAWQALLGLLQFTHGLILTYKYKKDPAIWNALRNYWIIAGLVLTGLIFKNQHWFPAQLDVFLMSVLPWFNAIYITMLTYRYSKKEVIVN